MHVLINCDTIHTCNASKQKPTTTVVAIAGEDKCMNDEANSNDSSTGVTHKRLKRRLPLLAIQKFWTGTILSRRD